jgi:hypothetical protein
MADVEVKKIVDFDAALIAYFRSEHAALMQKSMKLVIITKTSKLQSKQVLKALKRLKLTNFFS